MRGVVALAALLVVLVGCGGGDPGSGLGEAATPPPTQEPSTLALSDVVWTTAVDPATGAPQDEVRQFPNDAPVIITAVPVEDAPAGATLTATWTIDGMEVPEATMTVTTESRLASGWASFRFTRQEDRLFPLGVLLVTVSDGEGTTVSGSVEIVLPTR